MDQSAAALDPSLKEDTPFVVWLIRTIQRIADNAIVTREIRTRLRGKLDNIALRNLAMLAVVVTLGMYEAAPDIAAALGGWAAKPLFGTISSPVVQIIANILACWLIVLALYCVAAGFVAVRTFSVERDKSTLGFLLLTPMSNSSIVRGKAGGVLLSSGVYPIAIAGWTLILATVIMPTVGGRALVGWALIVCSSALCYTAVGMLSIALGAIAARWNVSPGCWGITVAITSQVMVNGGRLMFGYVADLLASYGIQGIQLYFIWLGLCGLVIALSYVTAVFLVNRMRRGDLAFAASKRDN
jgi:ABC-type transport system involved in multi-copper enzyme maturation permease subunit